ncbi:MAG: sulfatase [Phycisphaeraceae bacterium]
MKAFMATAALLLFAAVGLAEDEAAQPMNVVVLVSDDQRWDSLGAAGNTVIHTPRLDELAAEGVRFTQGFVTTSICMTSRASILTGQYMSRHGVDRFGVQLDPEAFAQSYPGVLREAGYWTGFVGKYGVGAPRKQDFDFLRNYQGRHWMQVDGERVHVTERNARDSLEFLKTRPTDQPFCLSVSFFAPHAEDAAEEQYLPQDWSGKFYEGVEIPPSPLDTAEHLQALPAFLQQPSNEGRVRYHWRFDTPERYQEYMTNYYRLITEVDDAVGRVIDELKAQGVYENTLILFIGDNGYFHADRKLADKWYPYEQSIRVPLVVHDPRLPKEERGIQREQIALNIDLAPTVVAAAGVAVPEAMQGENLSPLYLSQTPPSWRDEFFYEHPTISNKDRIPRSHAVIRRDWKYVYWPEFEQEQLFNLENDPQERRNLASDPAYADRLETMRQKLATWRERAR